MCRNQNPLTRNNEIKILKNNISLEKGTVRQSTNNIVNPLQNLERMRTAIVNIDLKS